MQRNTKPVWDLVKVHRSKFHGLSDRIWGHPELNCQECFALGKYRHALASQGFSVTEGLADIPTAGESRSVIARLGEYDALPGLSRGAAAVEEMSLSRDGSGHGCGYNMLGAASLLAATAVKEWQANRLARRAPHDRGPRIEALALAQAAHQLPVVGSDPSPP